MSDIVKSSDRLTRETTVVLLLDHQVGPLWEPDAAGLRRNVSCLAAHASALDIPTIVSTMSCDEWGPIISELTTALPGVTSMAASTATVR